MKKPNRLSFLIKDLIESNNIKQTDMAEALGFAKPNIITMFKDGTTRIPFEHIPSIAKYLGYDASAMIQIWYEVYAPNEFAIINEYLIPKPSFIANTNEQNIIRAFRVLSSFHDPKFNASPEQATALNNFITVLEKSKKDLI